MKEKAIHDSIGSKKINKLKSNKQQQSNQIKCHIEPTNLYIQCKKYVNMLHVGALSIIIQM